MAFYCYIVASGQLGALYIGSTDALTTRVGQHKNKAFDGFTAKYGCDQLVWFRVFETREAAFRCERQMKEWRRSWKILLIQEENPNWRDLYWEVRGVLAPGQLATFLDSLTSQVEG
ncbi:MAG: GIY-YIG nuclease family protein [Caulobacteraceae bacterium]|nr:MAG: GIY-YIG nuclease family protein [Caulobacteraceae bacterium]